MSKKFNKLSDDRLIAAILFTFSFLLYTNSIFNDYNMDDELVTKNHRLTSKGISAIPEIFSSPYYKDDAGNEYEYRPVVLTSFAIEHQFFGDNAHVSHFFNVLLYSISVVFLFVTLRLLFAEFNYILPLVVSLLFLAHPIHTEVVASIKNRDEILSLLGGIAALYWVIKFVDRRKIWNYFLFVACFLFGVLSKQSVISYVIVIPLAVLLFRKISQLRLFLITLPLSIIFTLMLPIYLLWHEIVLAIGIVIFPVTLNYLRHHRIAWDSIAGGFSAFVFKIRSIRPETIGRWNQWIFKWPASLVSSALSFWTKKVSELFLILKRLAQKTLKFPRQEKADSNPGLKSEAGHKQSGGWVVRSGTIAGRILFFCLLLLSFSVALALDWKLIIVSLTVLVAGLLFLRKASLEITILMVLTLFASLLTLNFKTRIFLNPVLELTLFVGMWRRQYFKIPIALCIISIPVLIGLDYFIFFNESSNRTFYTSTVIEYAVSLILYGVSVYLFSRPRLRRFSYIIPTVLTLWLLINLMHFVFIYWISSFSTLLLILWSFLVIKKEKLSRYSLIPFILVFSVLTSVGVYTNDQSHPLSAKLRYEIPRKASNLIASLEFESQLLGIKVKEKTRHVAFQMEDRARDVQTNLEDKTVEYSQQSDEIRNVLKQNVQTIATSPAPEILPQVGRQLSYVEVPILFASKLTSKIATSFYVVGKYLQLLFVPYPLRFYYGYRQIPIVKLSNGYVIFSIMIYLGLTIIAVWYFKKYPVLSFGIIAYLAAIIPFSNLLAPIAGMVGERLAYVASVGFCIALVYVLCLFFKIELKDQQVHFPGINKRFKALWGIVLILFSAQTFARNFDWKNPLILFEHDMPHLQQSSRAHNLLATHLVLNAQNQGPDRQRMLNEAVAHFKKSLEIYPRFPYAWYDLGRTYILLGDKQNAIAAFENSTKVDTGYAMPDLNLGILLEEKGDLKNAAKYYSNAIRLDSSLFSAYNNLSFVYFKMEDMDRAIKVSLNAANHFPKAYEPYVNIGKIYYNLGDMPNTILFLEKGFSINPDDPQLKSFLCGLFQKEGNTDKIKLYCSQ